MMRGVQMGFGECLGPEPFDLVESWGAEVVRIGVEPDKHAPEAIVAELVGRSVTPVICVDLRLDVGTTVDAAQAQLPRYWLELGNEPLLHEGWKNPRKYAAYAERQIRCADDAGLPRDHICVASIPNCESDTLRWLDDLCWILDAMDPDRELQISFHRYARVEAGRQRPLMAHRYHRNRLEEWNALLDAAHDRALVCTEFGFDAGVRESGGHQMAMLPTRQGGACRRELEWMASHGLPFAIWYQLNDGPTTTFIDRYGLRASDGTVKQDLVDALFAPLAED